MTNQVKDDPIYIRIPLKALSDLAEVVSQIDETNTKIWSGEIRAQVKKAHNLIEQAAGRHAGHIYAPDETTPPQEVKEVSNV